MKHNAIIVRYGEISLKGKNRHRFELQLLNDIKSFFRESGCGYKRAVLKKGRIFIRGIETVPPLERVLGIHSYSPALELEKIVAVLEEAAARTAEVIEGADSFCVRCQRTDKKFALDSMEVERRVGEILVNKTGISVDLENPAILFQIEIGLENIYIFTEKIPAFGGFPYGSAGRLVSLMSSGIDSPVATFQMMKRGVEPILVHYKVSDSDFEKVVRLKEHLETYTAGREIKLHSIDRNEVFGGRFQELYDNQRFHSYMCVLCKYLMHKKAGEIARAEGALGIITGDNLAQVASQTLKNLFAYHTVSGMPVYSPLIGFEKEQTIQLARSIGTFDLSVAHSIGCTPPSTPKTGVSMEKFRDILADSNLD